MMPFYIVPRDSSNHPSTTSYFSSLSLQAIGGLLFLLSERSSAARDLLLCRGSPFLPPNGLHQA